MLNSVDDFIDNFRKVFIFLLFLFFIGTTIDYFFTTTHENIHKQIAATYGYDAQTHISLWFMGGSYTTILPNNNSINMILAKGGNTYSQRDVYDPDMLNLQGWNEIIGYYVQFIIQFVVFGTIIWKMFDFQKMESDIFADNKKEEERHLQDDDELKNGRFPHGDENSYEGKVETNQPMTERNR